jgi:hypothetical protein
MKAITNKIESISLKGITSHGGFKFTDPTMAEPLYMATDEFSNFLIVFLDDSLYAINEEEFSKGFFEEVDTKMFLPMTEEEHISIIKNRFGSISIIKCDIICQQSYEAFYQGIGK